MEITFEKELEWLSDKDFKHLYEFWSVANSGLNDKNGRLQEIISRTENNFLLHNALEGLSKIELKILLYMSKFKNGITLGEISKKLFIPPQTLEVELQSLRFYGFLYLRRNRERLTNTRDKYYLFDHLINRIKIPIREGNDNFLSKKGSVLFKGGPTKDYYSIENIREIIQGNDEKIKQVIEKAFLSGGTVSLVQLKKIVGNKIEETLEILSEKRLGKEVVFFDDEFYRFLVIPKELMDVWGYSYFLKDKPVGTTGEYLGFDFILNLKKTLFYIQSKGVVLTQALRLKLADNRKLVQTLIPANLDPISPIKLLDPLEFILPILKLLDVLTIKDCKLSLAPQFQEFISKPPTAILSEIIRIIFEKGDKVGFYEEIFNPSDMPFFTEDDFYMIFNFMEREKSFGLSWMLSRYLQEKVYKKANFLTSNLNRQIQNYERRFVHTIFYLFLFGLISYEKVGREIFVSLNRIGKAFLDNNLEHLEKDYYSSCLFFNPDLSIIVDKNLASEMVLYIMKAFTKIEDENQVLTLSLNRDTFQQGVMIGFTPTAFTNTILNCFKTPLPQNVEYFLQEWSTNIQIASISQKTIIQVEEKDVLDNLIQQPKLKHIFEERLGEKAAIVAPGQEQNLIVAAEKLNIIITLFH